MKLRAQLSLTLMAGLVTLMTACGGSSDKTSGAKGDEVSRKNAFDASVGASQAAYSDSGKSSTSFTTNSFTSFEQESSSGKVQAKCDNGGSIEAEASVQQTGEESGVITLNAKMDKCAETGEGEVSGDLKIVVTVAEQSIQMTLNGDLNAKGKNKKGEMAEHSLKFNNLAIGLGTSEMNEGGLASSNISCTGTVEIDGVQKTCEELAKEAEAEADTEETADNGNTENEVFQGSKVLQSYFSGNSSQGDGYLYFVLYEEKGRKITAIEDIEVKLSSDIYVDVENELITTKSIEGIKELLNLDSRNSGQLNAYSTDESGAGVAIWSQAALPANSSLQYRVVFEDGGETLVKQPL